MTHWSSLTILLPLKDRVSYTQRWLAYAERLPCRILIADGSADGAAARLVEDQNVRGGDIDYVRYPFDASYADYFGKLADALGRVTTPYVAMADNDDLLLPDGVRRAVEFLDANPSYVACGGQCAVFWLAGAGASDGAVYGDRVQWKCTSQYSTDVSDTAVDRLRERCLGANDVFYAIHRTERLRGYFEAVHQCGFRDLFLMEQLVMFLTAIAGKTRQLDVLYIARQQDSPGSSGGAHQERFGDWYDRMLVPTWSEDFTRFADCAAGALARADDIPVERARRLVVESYKASVAPSLLGDLVEEPTVTWSMPLVLQLVRRLVNMPRSSPLRRAALALYRQTRWLSHDFVHGTEFRARRAGQAAREFRPVASFLTRPAVHHSRTAGT